MSSLDIPFGCQVDRCRGHRRRRLVDDHSAGVKEAVALANRLGVKPETNPTSKSLKNGAKRAAARLKKESASRSTRTYINIEIAYHQAVSTREERPHPERAEQGPGANTARKWALPHGAEAAPRFRTRPTAARRRVVRCRRALLGLIARREQEGETTDPALSVRRPMM